MTQKAGKVVGEMSTMDLAVALGDTVEICRSANERAKYPIYIRTEFGPINFNNAGGQEMIIKYTAFNDPEDRPRREKPEEPAPVAGEAVDIPEEKPEPAPKKSGLMKLLFGGDE